MQTTRDDPPPEVAVVVPTGNGGPYLRVAVASVVAQTLGDWELVVVANDCPDDLSDLEQLDPRVRVVREPRRGVSRARNLGVAVTSAPLVAFLDDDDVCLPDRLERQVAELRADPGAGLCSGRFQRIDADGGTVGPPRGEPRQYRDVLRGCFDAQMSTLMVRRSLFIEVGGFDPALVTGEDIDFLLRAEQSTRVAFVDGTVTQYRRHSENTSGNPWTAQHDIEPILRKHRRWARRQGRDDLVSAADDGIRMVRRVNARSAYDNARQARKVGDYPEVLRSAAISLAIDPLVALDDIGHFVGRLVSGRSGANGSGDGDG